MEPEKLTKEEWYKLGYEKANEILGPMPLLKRLEILQNTPQSVLPYDYWLRKSKAELMQWYMNALTTHYSCGGHWKAARNEERAEEYKELMKKYKVPVPPNEISFVLGEFNGDGTT